MVNLSYALSSQLRGSLQKIDVLRRKILLAVILPRHELRFRWQALVGRIFWALAFSQTPQDKKEIIKTLSESPKKRLTSQQQAIVNFRKALDYIAWEWQASQKPVSASAVLTLHHLACSGKLRISQAALKNSLSYFQTREHPVIQAGLISFQTLALAPFTHDNDRLSRLMTYLFFYKEGFDCRGLLVLDEYFQRNLKEYQQVLVKAKESATQTIWLEYFAKAVQGALEKVLAEITANKTRMEVPAARFKLNERQKKILALLENPETTMTNRQAQKLFKISQITSSRDLAKLASLRLLFVYGKGRSVYYTKA